MWTQTDGRNASNNVSDVGDVGCDRLLFVGGGGRIVSIVGERQRML